MSLNVLFMFRRCESETPDSLVINLLRSSRRGVDMLITFFESVFKPVIPVLFRLPDRVDNFKSSVDNMLTSVDNFRIL